MIKTQDWSSMLSNYTIIEANPRFLQKKTKKKKKKKKHFGRSLSATKRYPYKARSRNLSAISLARNVGWMYAHTPMHKAEIWKK